MNSSRPVVDRLGRDGILALLLALTAFGLTGLNARSPDGNLRGFPWSYTVAVSPCANPNPFNGCGSTIEPLGLSLDFAFWALVSLAIVSVAESLIGRRMASSKS